MGPGDSQTPVDGDGTTREGSWWEAETEPSENAVSDRKLQLLLHEFERIDDWVKHRERMFWTIFTVFFSGALVGLPFFLEFLDGLKDATAAAYLSVAFASLVSLALFFWGRIQKRESFYVQQGYARMREIEAVLGYRRNLYIHAKDRKDLWNKPLSEWAQMDPTLDDDKGFWKWRWGGKLDWLVFLFTRSRAALLVVGACVAGLWWAMAIYYLLIR